MTTHLPGERLAGQREDLTGGDGPVVGVLALQGDVLEHMRMLAGLGARPRRVRSIADLDGLEGIVIPGGESTTIGKLLRRYGMLGPLRDAIVDGLPAFGTCAGMILLARELEQEAEQPLLGVLDVRVRRNAFGRQRESFDDLVEVAGIAGGPVDVSYIRAPWVEEVLPSVDGRPEVEVLARSRDRAVVVRQGHVLAAAFHPELTGDERLHAHWLAIVTARRTDGAPTGPT